MHLPSDGATALTTNSAGTRDISSRDFFGWSICKRHHVHGLLILPSYCYYCMLTLSSHSVPRITPRRGPAQSEPINENPGIYRGRFLHKVNAPSLWSKLYGLEMASCKDIFEFDQDSKILLPLNIEHKIRHLGASSWHRVRKIPEVEVTAVTSVSGNA